jgi:hypothetical protein
MIFAPALMPTSWQGHRRGYGVWELVCLFQDYKNTQNSFKALEEFRHMLKTLWAEEQRAIEREAAQTPM